MATDKARKNFALLCSVVVGAITLVSLSMTYSVFWESFADWPLVVRIGLTAFCCVAIEVTAMGLVYGLMYALSGTMETVLGIVMLMTLVAVMGVNLVTHSQQVRKVGLSNWQSAYIEWVGMGTLVFVLSGLIAIKLADPENRKRRLQRKLDMALTEAEIEAQMDVLENGEIQLHLLDHKDSLIRTILQKMGIQPKLKPGFQNQGKQ
jgi:hypothetical protein